MSDYRSTFVVDAGAQEVDGLISRVNLANQIAIILAGASGVYAVIFFALGLDLPGLLALLCVAGFLVCMGAIRFHLYTVGRVGISVLLGVGVLVYASLFGPSAGLQLLLFPAIGMPVVIFEWRERVIAGVAITFTIGCFYLLEWQDYSLLPRAPVASEVLRSIYLTWIFTTFVLVLVPLLFFARARARAEVGLLKINMQLQALNKELNQARDEAVEASEAKSTFLAQMSHELRNPLNAIIGYSELVTEDLAEASFNQAIGDLEKIHGAGTHLLSVINDILDLSKIEAGRIEMTMETFSVGTLVQDAAAMIRPMCDKKGNELEVKMTEGVRTQAIRADRTRLRQILFNLLSNANKFTEGGTVTLKVTVEVDAEGRIWVLFAVQDTGIGMSPEVLKGLFQPFNRGDLEMTRNIEGTGLGLAISRRLCQLMGGDIIAVSELGRGSLFTLRISAHGGEAGDSMESGDVPMLGT
ncbi:MAG: HAMP domain-containing sensor histidine kinase [Nannocystaceae bacterium]